ncbi:MAG: hypothetical protein AM326_01745 [Candidatus Thorarchaeota archaeon SMTZ-45]|nr:MAG: hypothetical protein AM326_01745 [Candidatus Thorarchaeota archaeon SMTZ-45]
MSKRTFYITVALICTFGFLLILFVIFAEAKSGQIIVYDDEGNVEHVEKFQYTPDKTPYRPAPVKGLHIVPEEEVKEDVPELPVVDEEETKEEMDYRHDVNGSNKRKRDWRGRRKRIKKIENKVVDGKNVQVITRKEEDRQGRIYETKEYTIDNRSTSTSATQRKKERDNADQPAKFKTERYIRQRSPRISP